MERPKGILTSPLKAEKKSGSAGQWFNFIVLLLAGFAWSAYGEHGLTIVAYLYFFSLLILFIVCLKQ